MHIHTYITLCPICSLGLRGSPRGPYEICQCPTSPLPSLPWPRAASPETRCVPCCRSQLPLSTLTAKNIETRANEQIMGVCTVFCIFSYCFSKKIRRCSTVFRSRAWSRGFAPGNLWYSEVFTPPELQCCIFRTKGVVPLLADKTRGPGGQSKRAIQENTLGKHSSKVLPEGGGRREII